MLALEVGAHLRALLLLLGQGHVVDRGKCDGDGAVVVRGGVEGRDAEGVQVGLEGVGLAHGHVFRTAQTVGHPVKFAWQVAQIAGPLGYFHQLIIGDLVMLWGIF